MPKAYTEGHKAREITLAEAAIVKLQEAREKAGDRYEAKVVKVSEMQAKAKALHKAAVIELERGDWDRKIDAAEAHLAWLRAMPVPPAEELPAAEA